MSGKPALAALQKLLDLVVGYPVVLFIVQDRNQYVKVCEQILQPNGACDRQGDIGRRAPFRKLIVKLRSLHLDGIAQRLEQPLDQVITAAGCDDRQMGGIIESLSPQARVGPCSARSLQC